jgi:hypothetical protein
MRSGPRHAAGSMVGRWASCPGIGMPDRSAGRVKNCADSLYFRAACAARNRRSRRHSEDVRPLRVLYRDLSNLCSVPRRERLAARPHRPHSRHARKGWRAGRQDRSSPRSMPFLPFLHDDLRGEGGLRPSDRYRPRVYRGEIPETFRRARAAAHDRGTAPVPAPLRDGSATCEAVTAIRRRSAPSTAQFDRAGIRPADGRRVPASGRLAGERPTQNARRLARGLRAADA